MKDILGQVVPAGKSCEDMGVSFFSAEAVASIGAAIAGQTALIQTERGLLVLCTAMISSLSSVSL